MLDQVLGAGDGLKARFSLTKTYGSGADAYKRLIVKPVAASLRIAVAGVAIWVVSENPHTYLESTLRVLHAVAGN